MKKDVKDNVSLVEGLAEAIDWHVELCSLQQEKDFHSLLKKQLVKQQIEIDMLKETNIALLEESAKLAGSIGNVLLQMYEEKKED